MDEIGRDELLRLKRKDLKARLLGLQSSLSEEEQNILKECESEHPTELKTNSVSSIVSVSDDGVIHVPLYRPVELITKSIDDDTKKYHEEMKEHDELLNKKREELRQKGILRPEFKKAQIIIPPESFTRIIQEQLILNGTVKVLFDNDSLMKVYQSVNIPDEAGKNIDDFDDRLKQKREELRKRLISNKKIPLNKEDDFPTIVIPRGGSLS